MHKLCYLITLLCKFISDNIMPSELTKITIYVDGACSGNPGPGGWGAVLHREDGVEELSGSEPETTNNRMELKAAIEALRTLKTKCNVAIYTDSVYVKNGITQWIAAWKKNHWQTASGQDVKNKELWQQLDNENAKHQVIWRFVKGHSGNPGNERADALARAAAIKIAIAKH